MSERIRAGEQVTWTSQSAGYELSKSGEVLMFIPAMSSRLHEASSMHPRARVMVQPSTMVSRVDRYAVLVPYGRNAWRIYAPLATVVERQNPDCRRGS